MIRLFSLLSLIFSLAVHADTFDLNFPNPVKISELARIVYGDMLGENFILESDLLKEEIVITAGLRNLTKKTVDQAFSAVLNQQGYKAEKLGGVRYVRKIKEGDDRDLFFYRPKYRSASYLIDMTTTLFSDGKFSTQRQGRSIGQLQQIESSASQQKPVDTGTSAFSLQDKNLDAFVFQAPMREIQQLKQLLAQIDQPSGEVLVKAIVYEVSKKASEGTAVGLAVSVLDSKLGLQGGLLKTLGNALTVKIPGQIAIEGIYSALNTDSRFKAVSSPVLRAQSGSQAKFSSGADVPVLGAVQYDRNGNPFQSNEYKPSGVILSIRPQVRDEIIDLQLQQQISSFIPTTIGQNSNPTLLKREISTSLGVQDGDLVILGGLDESKQSADRSGLPFLPDWLQSGGREENKTEILLVLQVQKI